MILYKISVRTDDKKGLSFKLIELEVKETEKSYVGDGFRISKDKIMVIDTIYYETSEIISYHTYCLVDQRVEALDMLKTHVVNKVISYKLKIDNLYDLIKQNN
jgi:hypothetical protein